MARARPATPTLLPAILIAVVACATYAVALGAPFFFDDIDSTVENTSIVRLWPLVTDSGDPGVFNRLRASPVAGRPLVNLSLAVNRHFGGLDPFGYHVFNLAVHVLTALLLFLVVRRTLQLPALAATFGDATNGLALAAATLFAAHPLLTESVEYVTQRTELLSACCYLTATYAALRYWTAAEARGRARWMAAATLAAIAGAACKEMIVTLPATLLLFEWTFFRRSVRDIWKESRGLYAGIGLSWLVLLALNYDAPRGTSAGFRADAPIVAWWLTQAKVQWIYLKLVLWPAPLAVHYDLPLLRTAREAWPWLLAVLATTTGTVALLRRRAAAGFALGAVITILSPTIVVPMMTEIVAESRMYLPMAVIVPAVVVGGYALLTRLAADGGAWPRQAGTLIAVVLVVAAGVAGARHLALYNDEMALWKDTIASQPNDPLAHYNLGTAYGDRDQLDAAIAEFETALRLDPGYGDAHFNLAVALGDAGRPGDAIPHFAAALRVRDDDANDHLMFGLTLAKAGRLDDAIAQLRRAIALDPANIAAYQGLADAEVQANRPDSAAAVTERAIRVARERGQMDVAARASDWLSRLKAGSARVAPGLAPRRRSRT
ncbi:MAG TPA: tetratricopeptide repeat protein [Gemmatimonadaceae bacterium]|nr:tetratricopeptide repeat protein [Gemmatimonadaceae bacterium]